ncbi:DNA translocase FtsK 4TM domain-containing protein, partial [Agromyces albus]
MATSTRSNGRASGTSARGSGSRTAPTKKLPATRARATTKAASTPERPSILVRAWMGLAHVAGGAARALGPETLQKEERRDGLPFFIIVLAIAGAVVEWFFINDPVAQALDSWTFGGLFGRVAFALPVIMLLFAVWLFRHPSSVHDNTRIGIGLGLLLLTVSALCHLFGGAPEPRDGMTVLARAGGILGWMLAAPLTLLITTIGATIVVIVLLVLALLIITKTPPNRIPSRFRELYVWLFGAPVAEPGETDAAERPSRRKRKESAQPELDGIDASTDEAEPAGLLPWWRRNDSNREEDPAFATPAIDELTAVFGAGSAAGSFESPLEGEGGPASYGSEVLGDLERAESALQHFTGDVPRGGTGLRGDDGGATSVLAVFDEADAGGTGP